MNIKISTVKDSNSLPITLQDIKSYLKIESDAEEELLTKLAHTACNIFERYTNISLIVKEYHVVYNALFSYCLKIPITPVREVIEVVSLYPVEGKIKLNPKLYELQGQSLILKQSIYHDSLLVHFSAGFTAGEIPHDIHNLLLDHIAFLYENRGTNQQYDFKHYQPFLEYRL